MDDLFHEALNARLDEAQQRLDRVAQFTEAELIAADLEYLEKQRERTERWLTETAALERAYVARRGWAL